MTPRPDISIITSTYNRADVLRRAIDSVLAQRVEANWEMCIVGDCTPDHTEEVVASYRDERLRFYNLPEKSPPRAHGALAKNHGIFHMSRAPYIAYLDDDDAYHPDFLRVMLRAVRRQPHQPVFYCRSQYRDKKTGRKIWGNPFQPWLHRWNREKLMRYNFINTANVVHTRALVEEVGGWNSQDYFDDYDLWKRMSARHDFRYVNRPLVINYVEDCPPFFKRMFTKGIRILKHGRRLEDQG
ncbi:MAG: glycosyltransferase [Verrucomicrobiota bacterium]|jgi:glycosyltransferase involved in cell wall biosynthesis|nr:glycosyltransferase [Verrucomicrobiota bacterium]